MQTEHARARVAKNIDRLSVGTVNEPASPNFPKSFSTSSQFSENELEQDAFNDLKKLIDEYPLDIKAEESKFIDAEKILKIKNFITKLPIFIKLIDFTNPNNFERVCNYLLSCSDYAADTEEMQHTFKTAFDIYRKFKRYPEAMRVAQKMNNIELIGELMAECKDPVTLKQLAFLLARQRNAYESEDADL